MKRLTKGFTMIELLIVIAVLGVLAVAVLSAINPIEQINRGRDTGSRSDAEQILSAVERFYTQTQNYPWQTVYDPTADSIDWIALSAASSPNGLVLNKLATAGVEEIKQSFADRLKQANYGLFLYKMNGSDNGPYVCFVPRSGAFKTEADKRCSDLSGGVATISDFPTAACGSGQCGNSSDCICLP